MRFFMRAWHGKRVNWKRFFRNYQSVVDWPACAFYSQLMDEYPDAKILLNVRDPEQWYDSMAETIWAIQPAFPFWFPPMVRMMHEEIIWEGSLKGVFRDRSGMVARYREYIEEVKRTVPSDRLLVYDVKQGWEPLCSFLGVPVPKGLPFPRKNDRRSFRRLIKLLKLLNWFVPAFFALALFFVIFVLSRFYQG
jgi:hypothetical protein